MNRRELITGAVTSVAAYGLLQAHALHAAAPFLADE
jgi:hypothetical protein